MGWNNVGYQIQAIKRLRHWKKCKYEGSLIMKCFAVLNEKVLNHENQTYNGLLTMRIIKPFIRAKAVAVIITYPFYRPLLYWFKSINNFILWRPPHCWTMFIYGSYHGLIDLSLLDRGKDKCGRDLRVLSTKWQVLFNRPSVWLTFL